LGADPEIRQAGGTSVCKLRIATDEGYTDRDGNKKDITEWHSVEIWGKQADHCAQYLTKGSECEVIGSIATEEWTDKDGGKRKSTKIKARQVLFCGKRPEGERTEGGPGGARGLRQEHRAPAGGHRDADSAQQPAGKDPWDDIDF
jgi:single-strand DNA-binding protein